MEIQQPISPMQPAMPPPTFETGGAPPAPMPGPAPISPQPKPPGFFENITVMDIGIVALVSLALYYSIYASRQAIRYYQTQQKQNSSDIAALKAQIKTITGGS